MRAVTGLPFRDTQCGFKLFRASAAREVFLRQKLDGFSFDVEILVMTVCSAIAPSRSPCAGATAKAPRSICSATACACSRTFSKFGWNRMKGIYK